MKVLPPVSPWSACFRLFFVVVCARDCEDFFLILSRAQKYWRETHLLVPLPSGIGQLLTLYCPGGRQVLGCAVRFFLRFLPGLIFWNPQISADFFRFCGTHHIGIKSFQGKVNLFQNPLEPRIRPESGGKDP